MGLSSLFIFMPKSSIGSLAALAGALAVSPASAQVVVSSFPSDDLSNNNGSTLFIDINGDSTDDFQLTGHFSFGNSTLSGIGGNRVAVAGSGSTTLDVFTIGQTIDSGLDFNSYGNFGNFINQGLSFVGLQFSVSGQTHYGWLEFDFNGSDSFTDGTLSLGAWNTLANGGATISDLSAVPEPSTVGLIGGLAAGLGVAWQRLRRKPSVAPASSANA